MEVKPGWIIRRSIFTFLKDFHYFTNNPVILLLPFSASILVFQSIHKSLFIPRIYYYYVIDDLNLPHTIYRFLYSLPFALSSLVIAKASIIEYLHGDDDDLNKPKVLSLYKPLVLTYLCNTLLTIFITLATSFLLLVASNFIGEFFAFSPENPLLVLAVGVVFYMVLTHTMIICNLSLVVAGMDGCNGYYNEVIQKACLLRKSTGSMALLLALPFNLGLGAIESLFGYRIIRAYQFLGRINLSMVVEGLLIAYMFSLIIVVDTIACCLFIRSCYSQIDILKEDSSNSDRSQSLDEIA